MKIRHGFASDNNSGIHPSVLRAIHRVNKGHVFAYGDDPYTRSAIEKFKEHLGKNIDVFFVFGGTGANILALQAMTKSFNAVICANTAHLHVDECGAPEKNTGCKLLTIPTSNGKLTVDQIKHSIHGIGDPSYVQTKVISIAQTTELGTVYTPEEIKAIADYAHSNGMFLHMDGARIANAAASLGVELRKITNDVGVDVLYFGGTKNGMMTGEAVVVFNKKLSSDLRFLHKQCTQLPSKMRFIAAQFEALLSNDLWYKNALHANKMAKKLAQELETIPEVKITQEVQANGVFAVIPKGSIPLLQQKYPFYVWDEENCEVRWMTSFDTTENDIENFVRLVKRVVKK